MNAGTCLRGGGGDEAQIGNGNGHCSGVEWAHTSVRRTGKLDEG